MSEKDPTQDKSKVAQSKRLSDFEDNAIDGIVDSTRTVKSAVDTTVFGAIKGVVKGSIVAAKGVFSSGKTVTRETVKGVSNGVRVAKEEPSSIKRSGTIVTQATKGLAKGVTKGTVNLVDTAIESVKTIASETAKGIQKTTTDLTDSKEKMRKPQKD